MNWLRFPGKPGIPGDHRHKDIHMLLLFCHIRILLINLLRMIYDMSYKLFAKAQVALLTVGNDELDVGNNELDVEGSEVASFGGYREAHDAC